MDNKLNNAEGFKNYLLKQIERDWHELRTAIFKIGSSSIPLRSCHAQLLDLLSNFVNRNWTSYIKAKNLPNCTKCSDDFETSGIIESEEKGPYNEPPKS